MTVLAGFNAAGKSNFIDVLRFVSDALTTSPGRAVSARGGLDRVLCHAPEAGVRAASFSIRLDLGFGARSERVREAVYSLEVGRGGERRDAPVVLREECRVRLSGGEEEWFVSTPERFEASALIYAGERAAQGEHDRLFLPASVFDTPFREVEAALRGMRFYDLDPAVLSGIDDDTQRHTALGPHGEHLGHVLGYLAETDPAEKEYLDGFLRAVIPQALGVDERREGEFSTVQARFWSGDPVVPFWQAVAVGAVYEGDAHVNVFRRQELSEGTLRAAGVLAALFQPGTSDGSIPLVSLEEPERAIHPANASALFEAMHAASERTQVIATTQSSDLLDDEYVEPGHLRMVEMSGGITRIGELDDYTSRHLTANPSQLAQMHRQGHLRPASSGKGT
ncbi:AAA family ATPase [Streptosporangium sp. NPDC000396]|uniref:AAA family ATPase n=1 Tax=Streptosporangium sp. NPDC000396 TaxID=3366185 RepID=UPI00369D173A